MDPPKGIEKGALKTTFKGTLKTKTKRTVVTKQQVKADTKLETPVVKKPCKFDPFATSHATTGQPDCP
ncbi:hypothetical protein BH11MYX2_BH11MYX2_07580 [soil metagenome]